MTRRRALLLIFGALALVFIVGSIVTVAQTRSQLIRAIDDDLETQLDIIVQFSDSDALDALDAIETRTNAVAVVLIDDLGTVEIEILAGPVADPLPRPDLPVSRIIDRVGETFTVDGTDGGPKYRVTVGDLGDGRYIALGAPLDEVRDTLAALAQTLLLTLFGIVAVMGLIFWTLLRASLRPYDELIDTAAAIADGDMDRRAVRTTTEPGIERLTNSLNTMLDRLQESFEERRAAERRVKQFAADASHELRTPITTIAGYSEVYLSGAATDTDSVVKQMTRINREAGRMGRLVNQLLTLARLDQGEGLGAETVDVAVAVADVVSDARIADPGSSITSVGVDHAEVVGDPDALQQVFANLVANTKVHAPGSNVVVDVSVGEGHVVVTVTDDGPGMTDDVAAHVFDRFFRAEESRTSSVRSSGLGLSIVASIVAAHGGTIGLETAVGRGATFTVRLPAGTLDTSAPTPI